jgi:hypothetical protein
MIRYGNFHLLDLPSQAVAVQRQLHGKPVGEKIEWLREHGRITLKRKQSEDERQVYFFESSIGRECAFFIDGEEFVFFGEHTTYVGQD